jgi:hypothetical protein
MLTGQEVGTQSAERIKVLSESNKGKKGPRRNVAVYDDTDYTYKSNSRAVQNSRDRKKVSKQFGAGGKKFAPWQNIDEAKVEKNKAQRKAAKAGKKGGFRNPFA